MFSVMSDPFSPTSEEAISRFEKERDVQLPMAYRKFLLTFNGGRPREDSFPCPGVVPAVEFEIQFFLGVDAPRNVYDIAHVYDLYFNGFPHGIVPIACDSGINYYCLDLRNSGNAVTFWDKRHFWGTGEWREEDLYFICETFDDFLAMLHS